VRAKPCIDRLAEYRRQCSIKRAMCEMKCTTSAAVINVCPGICPCQCPLWATPDHLCHLCRVGSKSPLYRKHLKVRGTKGATIVIADAADASKRWSCYCSQPSCRIPNTSDSCCSTRGPKQRIGITAIGYICIPPLQGWLQRSCTLCHKALSWHCANLPHSALVHTAADSEL
jgi:hypothetical protein